MNQTKKTRCFTCGKEISWYGHPFLKFWQCTNKCKKLFPGTIEKVKRFSNATDLYEFLAKKQLQHLEIVLLWNEVEKRKKNV